MEKGKKLKRFVIILTAALILGAVALVAWLFASQGARLIQADGQYSFSNPEQTKAEPDAGFVIDGVLDEAQYQNSNWLKLKNTEGGAGVDVAATSYFGENGLYIVFDITESSRIYFNPNRPSYLNSCIEMYLASSSVASMSSNQLLEIDMLPNGDLSIRQRTAKDNWVNVASTDDKMAILGATTKGGPVNKEECTGYSLELFMPWAYLEKLGMNIVDNQDFFYVNPVHITSYNYEGTQSGTDRYWYSFATQLGGDGWNDVPQYFRLGANGALGTVPVKLNAGAHYTITGNDSVVTGMLTNVDITPDEGYAISSILVNGQEYIHRVAYNKDGSITLQLRGQEGGLTVGATAEAVTEGKKTLSGSVQVHKLGGDTLEGVSISYKGPGGEKPLSFESDGSFLLSDLEQGYYIITAEKSGYAPINRGIYLSRDVKTELILEYQVFQTEVGYNWILDQQNDGVLNRFGGSGKILTVDSYNKFRIDGQFRYDTQLAEAGNGNNYKQQRAGIQIKFSNGKYWRVDLMLENGVYKVQYATHSEGTLFTWKTVHCLTDEQIAKYCSQEGIQLSVLRDGNYAWVCLDGKPIAIEVLDSEYANLTAQLGFEGWISNQQIEEMEYNISTTVVRNLRSFYFTTNSQWDISGQMEGLLTLPEGGSAAIPFYGKYTDVDLTLKNVKEHDSTGKKPGRTDILLEFDTNEDGKADKSVSFGIVCTDRANKICWVQTLGNADNYIPATRIKGLYKLSSTEAAKYLNGEGVQLQVIRKGTEVYVFLEGEEVAIWDLTQNNSGVTDKTPVVVSVRHYDAEGDVTMNFEISGEVGEIKVDKVFKDNEKWDLSKEQQGVVSLPGGGTDLTLQMLKKYQNIDLTVTAREHDTTGEKFGRTDVLFEFDLNKDGNMDKNVSFGIVQLAGGRCVLQTLGWVDNHIPANRINELYELTYAQAQKYKTEGIDLRVVRYETTAYLYLEDTQVAVFDLTQNNSGVTANTEATIFLRHYDAVADAVVIPFKVTQRVEKPEIIAPSKSTFKPHPAWDMSKVQQGVIALPGGGTNMVTFNDSYMDLNVAIENVKEYDATGKKPGRTDILLEFDTNADGKADKSISFGIVCTDRATNSCWVQTLGNAENYIPATRIKGLYKLNTTEAAKYLSGEGVELRLIRKGMEMYVFIDGKTVAIWDLTQNNSGVTADTKATVSIRHYDAEGDVTMNFEISGEVGEINVDKVFKDNEKWDLSKEQQGVVSLTGGGTDLTLQMLKKYQNIDLTVTAREHDTTGEKFGRTDVLFEFDLNNDGSMDKNVSFGIVQLAGGRCVLQTLGWADNHIPATRINELYELTYTQAQKYKGEGIDLRVVRYETTVYLYLEDTQVAVFDLTQNNSGVTANTEATVFLRHYDAVADAVVIPFKVAQEVEKPEIVEQPKPVFKPNYKWDLSGQYEGSIALPGGDDNAVAFYETFTDIDLTITAKENKAANAENGGRTDVLFEFENGKNVSFGIVKWSDTSSCIVETLGNGENHIPAIRKNTLYTLTNNETDAYLTDGVELRLVRSGTDVYVIVEGVLVEVFDLTQNHSGVTADMKATVSLRHYDAVTDQVVIPFVVSDQVDQSQLQQLPTPVFKSNFDAELWDISGQHDGYVTVIGGGGATDKPLQFAGTYENIDLSLDVKDYADSSTAARTDVEFTFDVDGDGVIDTTKGDQTVTFGAAYADNLYCVQTRAGTLLNWKRPYEFTQAEKDQYIIDANEIAASKEEGLDFRIIRYGTTIYLFVENKQVAICDLTKCANSSGDKASGVKADTKMFVYLRHYDDAREAGVQIPYSISTDVVPVEVIGGTMEGGTFVGGPINYYVNNQRLSKNSDTHFMNEVVTVTAVPDKGYNFVSLSVDGQDVGGNTYSFAVVKDSYTVDAAFEEIKIFENNYDSKLWDLSGQHDGYVTINGAGGTGTPLKLVGSYQNVDLTLNVRNYVDSNKLSRTEFGFEFDVDGDGVINTSKGDHTVSFGIVDGNKIQSRSLTLFGWKSFYELDDAEKAQLVIDADEIAAGNENGLNLRVIRYGTTVYILLEGKQVAICDLTKGKDGSTTTGSGITADTEMFVYLRHYDAVREAGVQIPFSISTDVNPVEITGQAENGTVSTASTVNHYVNNGRISTTSDVHFLGEKITLTTVAADQYVHSQTKLNGEAVTMTNGAYTFSATEDRYEVESVFRKKLFVDNADAKWDLSQQNLGTVTLDGIEKTQGIATLIGGGNNAVAFRDQYTYIDLTITAKENKTAEQEHGGRTDILFEFDTDNNGTIDKNVSFGLVRWNTYCNVETLGNKPNFIPAERQNVLYTLNKAETEAYLADGVELRVIRDGTNVSIMVEGKLVNTFDLTQNNSGVTADMPTKVSLRHYDALPDKVVIPFAVTGELQQVFFDNNYNANIWDVSNQSNGLVVLPNGGGSTADPLVFNKTFGDVDVSLVARDYADAESAARTDLEFIFDNGETVTFGVVYDNGSYRIQNRGGTLLNWKTPYFITEQELIDAYVVTAEELESGNPGGLNFRVVRYGTEFYLYLNDVMVKGYDFSYKIAADTSVTVKLRHYDDAGVKVEIPFAITEDVTVDQLRLFTEKEPVTDYAYTFAVVPDTQIVAENDVVNGETNMAKLYDWIVANKESKNIQFVFGLGDVTDNNNEAEWTLAQAQHQKLLDAGIPYSVVRGNHDLSWYGKDKEAENYTVDDYTNYIGTEAYRAQFGGFYSEDNIANSWRTLEIGEMKYLLITLDWGAKDAILNWASDVIYQHPDHNVIITTHAYLFRDGTTIDDGDLVPPSANGGVNDGDDMWEKLVSKHENIVLVMSGHDPNENIVVNRSTGDNGNTVTAMLIDAQDAEAQEGSMGMVALLHFSADGKTVQVEYYSTAKEKYFKAENQFTTQLHVVEKAQSGTVPATGAYTNVALTEGKAFSATIADEQRINLSEKPYTLSAWINVPTSNSGRVGVILGNYKNNETANCLNFEIVTNGHPKFYFRNASNYCDQDMTFDEVDVRSDTQWVHLVFVVSGNRVSCYMNGELKQTLAAKSTIQLEDTRSELIIGGDLRSTNNIYFRGKILKLDLYSGILSAEKIRSLYENGSDAVTEGKIDY